MRPTGGIAGQGWKPCSTLRAFRIFAFRPTICETDFYPLRTENCFMGRIHVLPEQVANKIAAGEVVDRPASVVKELLENALHAGATRITINIEAGATKLIQITSNASGIVRPNPTLSLARH